MKITKSRLKKIIKEEVIREAVFDYDLTGDEPLSHGKIKLTYESHEVQCHPADADQQGRLGEPAPLLPREMGEEVADMLRAKNSFLDINCCCHCD